MTSTANAPIQILSYLLKIINFVVQQRFTYKSIPKFSHEIDKLIFLYRYSFSRNAMQECYPKMGSSKGIKRQQQFTTGPTKKRTKSLIFLLVFGH